MVSFPFNLHALFRYLDYVQSPETNKNSQARILLTPECDVRIISWLLIFKNPLQINNQQWIKLKRLLGGLQCYEIIIVQLYIKNNGMELLSPTKTSLSQHFPSSKCVLTYNKKIPKKCTENGSSKVQAFKENKCMSFKH